MPRSTGPATDHHIGLASLAMVKLFRAELLKRVHAIGYHEFRSQHVAVFGWLEPQGTRLTVVAARMGIGAPAATELVNDLQDLGYLKRMPDPDDGRAKLIVATRRGAVVKRKIHEENVGLQEELASLIGKRRFNEMVRTLEELIARADAELTPT
jgi:DNA-binding MarR family transcriptional regulator